MRSALCRMSIVAATLVVAVDFALADGGTLRVSETVGDYRIAAFTEPAPLRAGPVDVSALVQDAESGEPVEGADVTVQLQRAGRSTGGMRYPAARGAAINRLFYAAHIDHVDFGPWQLTVSVAGPNGPAAVATEINVGPPLPRALELWPWLVLPVVVTGVFGWRQWLKSRQTKSNVSVHRVGAFETQNEGGQAHFSDHRPTRNVVSRPKNEPVSKP